MSKALGLGLFLLVPAVSAFAAPGLARGLASGPPTRGRAAAADSDATSAQATPAAGSDKKAKCATWVSVAVAA